MVWMSPKKDVAYPYENRRLAQAISEGGALLSEYPVTAPPDTSASSGPAILMRFKPP